MRVLGFSGFGVWEFILVAPRLHVRARTHSHLILLLCPRFPWRDSQGYGQWGDARLPTAMDSWEMGSTGHTAKNICHVVQTYPLISPAILQLDKAKAYPNKCYAPNSR